MIAMIRLAGEFGNGAIMIGDIAKSEKIPQRFLENSLLELKNPGFLGSKLGKSGGIFDFSEWTRPFNFNIMEVASSSIFILPTQTLIEL